MKNKLELDGNFITKYWTKENPNLLMGIISFPLLFIWLILVLLITFFIYVLTKIWDFLFYITSYNDIPKWELKARRR